MPSYRSSRSNSCRLGTSSAAGSSRYLLFSKHRALILCCIGRTSSSWSSLLSQSMHVSSRKPSDLNAVVRFFSVEFRTSPSSKKTLSKYSSPTKLPRYSCFIFNLWCWFWDNIWFFYWQKKLTRLWILFWVDTNFILFFKVSHKFSWGTDLYAVVCLLIGLSSRCMSLSKKKRQTLRKAVSC